MKRLQSKEKTGYHFTSYENWKKIKKQGIIPYLINKPEISIYLKKPINGIFLFIKKPKDETLIQSIGFQMITKKTASICLIRARYENPLTYRHRKVIILHTDYIIDRCSYPHYNSPRAIINTKKISPTKIELLNIFKLKKWSKKS